MASRSGDGEKDLQMQSLWFVALSVIFQLWRKPFVTVYSVPDLCNVCSVTVNYSLTVV